MNVKLNAALFGVMLAVSCSAAWADELTVNISNDGSDALLVTVYDLNAHPRQKVTDGQQINGFASITVNLTPDASGHGRVAWTAATTDPDMRTCGHRTRSGLRNGATLKVSAGNSCGRQ
jgi:hypothetical protein